MRKLLFPVIVILLLAPPVAGAQARPASGSPGDDRAQSGTAPPTAVPLQTSTPHSDGTIQHVVQPGQAPLSIAEAYGISLSDLLTLNGLTANSVIYPEDVLLIQPSLTPTVTVPPSATPTKPPPTRRPTATGGTPTPVEIALGAADETPTPDAGPRGEGSSDALGLPLDTDRGPLIAGILVVAFLSLALPLLSALRRRS